MRYRGYYYDSETGFYYLQSHYYDPAIGRFINADSYATTDVTNARSSNMFAYCENDPVNRSDPTGEIWTTVAKAAVGAAVNVATTIVANAVAGKPLTDGVVGAAIDGAVTATVSNPIANALVSAGLSIYRDIKDNKSAKEMLWNAATSAGSSLIGSGVGKLYGKAMFDSFTDTASKRAMKAWGNELAGESGNLYKHAKNWTKDMVSKAVNHYAGSAYGTYLSSLFSSGSTIVSSIVYSHTR